MTTQLTEKEREAMGAKIRQVFGEGLAPGPLLNIERICIAVKSAGEQERNGQKEEGK